jgi:DNA-dependent protein kinase catalytic subunit
MIRFIPDGSMPSQLARKDEKRRIHREQMIKRQLAMMNKQVNLMRQYRVGDLPDIQIDFKDLLLPLMALVRRDSTIATEIFVEIFTEIYVNITEEKRRHSLGQGIANILVQSVKFDYGVVNCMHRVAIELLKIDQFSIDAEVIARTGKHSMSF